MLEDYGITIEESEHSRTIARRKRRVKTTHGLDDIGGIRRLYRRLCLRYGEPSAYRDCEYCYHSRTSICIVQDSLKVRVARMFIMPLDGAAGRSELPLPY